MVYRLLPAFLYSFSLILLDALSIAVSLELLKILNKIKKGKNGKCLIFENTTEFCVSKCFFSRNCLVTFVQTPVIGSCASC